MRLRRTDEYDTILDLDRVCFPGFEPISERYFSDRVAWWLAEDDGYPVAFGGIAPSSKLLHVGYLCRAGVIPECRGMGLQRRLIRVREAYARRQGWSQVRTDAASAPSANNLARMGYQIFRPEKPWSQVPGTIYFRKAL